MNTAAGAPAGQAPSWPARWLPGSLASRVFLLYVLSWLACVAIGTAIFYGSQYEEKIETAHQSGQMLVEVAAQTVSESAVIGDYDTIKRVLDTATHDSVFRRAQFIDLQGGQVVSETLARPGRLGSPPGWLHRQVGSRLYDVNRNIVVGGRDYGVLRMAFDADRVAHEIWAFVFSVLLVAGLSFLGGLSMIWFPLRRWLEPLQQPTRATRAPGAPEAIDPALIASAPREFRSTLETLSDTAGRLREELAERERVLHSVKDILSTLHPEGRARFDNADLGELVASLSRLVKERETMSRELAAAVEASDAANRAKSAFLATMSHELRTPLNGILGMAQLLHLGEADEATRREYAGVIHGSGITLLALLNDILDLSKIESGKVELEEADCSPAALISEAASMYSASAAAKGLALRVAPLSLPQPLYRSDPVRLRQMLANLVNNALKFTVEGSVTISCAEIASPAGEMLEFSVSDTGPGLTMEQRGRLFQRFSQIDNSNTRRAGGSGLGLSIVRGFAELLGGQAGVESEPGRGSRFWFRVPARLPAAAMAPAVPPEAPVALESQISTRFRGRVLVADDSPANRIVAERLLQRLGLEVSTARDGREALAAVAAGPAPDLVLMDVQMPEMDGLEATVAIRAREATLGLKRVPVIALTAAAYASDQENCRAAGMDGHIAKPILLASLASEIGRWLPARAGALPEVA